MGGAEPAGSGLPETVTALTAAAAAAAARWGLGGARPRLPEQLEQAVAGGQQEGLELGACPRPGGGGGCSWTPGIAGGGGFSAKQVSEATGPQKRRQGLSHLWKLLIAQTS